jgi:proline iminopeptidase
MRGRYPELEPYAHGMFDAGDGQSLYWETCGNPAGKPAVVLHGGPGSGCTPGFRRYFDPAAYRIALFDQRGAGRSLPHASDPATSLDANTTHHLTADIEALREFLGVDRWLVWGISWGSTLALAYAEQHPQRVSEIVLHSVTMTRPADIDWLYHGVGRFFPEEWARFRAGAVEREWRGTGRWPGGEGAGDDLVAAYHRLLNDPDPVVQERAAQDWCAWEDAVVSLEEGWQPSPRYTDPRFRMAYARIVTHYFHHRAWLEDGALLRGAARLSGIPGVLAHGRLDLGGPPVTAWELAQAWPDAELHLVGGGHRGGPGMDEVLIAATDRFASR